MKHYSSLVKYSLEKGPALPNVMQITSGDESNPFMLQALATSMTLVSQLEDDTAHILNIKIKYYRCTWMLINGSKY